MLSEWRARFDYQLKALEANCNRYLAAAERPEILPATKARLEKLAAATTEHRAALNELLAPLKLSEPAPEIEFYLALRTRLPPDQGLMTYFPNVHRDWCWGDEENASSIAIVLDALGERSAGRTLVLGSGAGRLAYDFHQQTDAKSTVSLDFNPLLSIIGRRISAGETLELHEFPLAPRDADQAAPLRQLQAPEAARTGLDFVIADVHRVPFGPKSFDTILTPWLIDILPDDFSELCARINHLLADDGAWINFGSLNFQQADPAAQYSPEECFAIIAQQGFESPEHAEAEIPYMCSPASRHGRRERVLSWRADKKTHVKRIKRHQSLPEWIVRGKDPIPQLEHFRVAAMSTRIHSNVISLIDGKRSISDIARLLEEQRVMPAPEAEASIRGLLIKLLDESQTRRP